MPLRDVKNWRVDDQFPGVAIDDILLLSDKLNSLYARAVHREHLQSSFMQLSGIIFMVKELEYHFNNFQQLTHVAKLHTARLLDSGYNNTLYQAKFEAIAYINTLGRINAWVRHIHASAPRINEISNSFRNKHTAHRSIDDPRGEPDDLQDLHALTFMFNLWNSEGDLFFQIQRELGETVELDIVQDHKTVSDEIEDVFSKALKPSRS